MPNAIRVRPKTEPMVDSSRNVGFDSHSHHVTDSTLLGPGVDQSAVPTAKRATLTPDIDEFFSLPHIVKPGETISSTAFTRKPGGKGANQAYAVAKAGGAVDLQGCIGTDGQWIKELLSAGGVGVETLQVVEEEVTGRAIIQSASDGENSIGASGLAHFVRRACPRAIQLTRSTAQGGKLFRSAHRRLA